MFAMKPANMPDRLWDPTIESLIERAWPSGDLDARFLDTAEFRGGPRWMSARAHVKAVSQLFHAESATGAACAALADRLAGTQAGRFLARQAIEESHHAELYRDYLRRLGDVAPMDEALEAVLSATAAWNGSPAGSIVAHHLILESEAIHLQQRAIDAIACPLFVTISKRVSADEARHVAFGRLYAKRALADLGLDERVAIYRWVKALWFSVARPPETHRGTAEWLFRFARQRYIEKRWPVQRRNLTRVGLIHAGEEAAFE